MGDVKRPDGIGGVDRMFDSEWMNVINHDDCYRDYSKDDAVRHAVKMTEQKMARHAAERVARLARERDELAEKLATLQTDAFDSREDERAELTRLRAVEAAAVKAEHMMRMHCAVLRQHWHGWFADAVEKIREPLSEACGRKG